MQTWRRQFDEISAPGGHIASRLLFHAAPLDVPKKGYRLFREGCGPKGPVIGKCKGRRNPGLCEPVSCFNQYCLNILIKGNPGTRNTFPDWIMVLCLTAIGLDL